jgi:ribonuclease P protein subunit POP4
MKMRTKKNILYSTFIGLEIEISNSSQHELIGLKGKVVDETKNLLVIEKEDGKQVKLPKVSSVFKFTLDDGSKMEILGKKICFRPEERPKKV